MYDPNNVNTLHTPAVIFIDGAVLSPVGLFGTPWTVACQTPLSMGFPRQ